ncbi:nitroreductase [Phaeobacter sp. B1627]|uniref:Acg family FMN-binding oxidoreductase n=1 Tax=Phaeobacter sp. B1627 TaxID=2583809 RepID=UPI00111B25E7|nr:nitroreductase [Phaeobacter sp. B1627]TNJ45128.1 nitroreductase [Phaeobacter sp. B1627]
MQRKDDDPWAHPHANFITGTTPEHRLRFLAGCAILAPSFHNTQPWLFASGPDWLDVLADRTRALAVVDPEGRELTISCGAAIGTFETAARRLSLNTTVTRCPDPHFPDHLAQITVAQGQPPDDRDLSMFDAIAKRRTDRSDYRPGDLPQDLMAECCRIAESLGTRVRFFSNDTARRTLVNMVAEADRIQAEDPGFRRERATWMHLSRREIGEGISGAGLRTPYVSAPAARLLAPTFDQDCNTAAVDTTKTMAGSPTLALLSSTADTVGDWLDTGRTLARMLLVLTARGFTTSYLNQPIEIAALRFELGRAAGEDRKPQILLRIGRSDEIPSPSVRRALSDVMITT